LDKYIDIEPIEIKSELILIKRKKEKGKKENELDSIKSSIEEIITFSYDKRKLLLYFSSKFWINLLKQYNSVDLENINNCYELRKLFKKYHALIQNLSKDDFQKSEKDKDEVPESGIAEKGEKKKMKMKNKKEMDKDYQLKDKSEKKDDKAKAKKDMKINDKGKIKSSIKKRYENK